MPGVCGMVLSRFLIFSKISSFGGTEVSSTGSVFFLLPTIRKMSNAFYVTCFCSFLSIQLLVTCFLKLLGAQLCNGELSSFFRTFFSLICGVGAIEFRQKIFIFTYVYRGPPGLAGS